MAGVPSKCGVLPSRSAKVSARSSHTSIVSAVAPARAGSLVIPTWSFARGNGRIFADPDKYADAGPVVGSGERKPWGWTLEYDIDFPVAGTYYLYIKYASAEARPIEVYFDARNMSKTCTGISLSPGSSGKPGVGTWKSSGARWELLRNRFGGPDSLAAIRNGKATAGKHTVVLASRRPLPHLVALRIETPEAFPEDWLPPEFTVRDIDSIPEKFRGTFGVPNNVDVAAMRQPVEQPPKPRVAGSMTIPAWTFAPLSYRPGWVPPALAGSTCRFPLRTPPSGITKVAR